MVSTPDDHTFVFVSGLHRSGTTQLHATLATHPDVSGMLGTDAPHDEGQHLQDVFPTARSHGGPGRFAFDPAAHLTEMSALATPQNAQRLFEQWGRYWDLDRRVLIEKSPPNLIRMRFLQALYPQARFVVIVRHPVVTVLATKKLATTKWMRRTLREASLALTARHWFAAHRLLLEDLPLVRRTHLLRWEDLLADPEGRLDAIAAFAGLDQRFERPDLDPQVDRKYEQQWAELSAAGDRRTRALQAVLAENADVSETFGYRTDDLRALGPVTL